GRKPDVGRGDQVRAHHQSGDRQGARHRGADDADCPCRRGDRMRRRAFIALLGGAAACSMSWPLAARAQQMGERVRHIGVLMSGAANDAEESAGIAALRQKLLSLGWVEGRNLRVDYRWASADPERVRAYAAELTALVPEVIVTGSNLVTTTVSQHTRTIPI